MRLGKYKHYKNILVNVLYVAIHSETLEELVVYEKLQDFGKYKKGSLWVRPKKMFLEKVMVNGKEIPRFKYIGK